MTVFELMTVKIIDGVRTVARIELTLKNKTERFIGWRMLGRCCEILGQRTVRGDLAEG